MYTGSSKTGNTLLIYICFMLILYALSASGCSSSSSSDVPASQSLMTFTPASFTYYSGGQKQDLEVYTERIAVSVADGAMDQLIVWLETDTLVSQPPRIEDLGRKNLVLVTLIEGATEEQILELIERLNASGLVDYATPVFGTEDEMSLITDEFIVRFLDTYSVGEIETYIASQNVTILERDFLWPKCYILGFTAQSGSNTLEVAREFYESGMVEFAHPNFITVMKPLWQPLLEEDFEAGFPQGWEAYDDNPADGQYYWGRVSSNDYPSKIDEYTEGDYKCWVSASHDPASPDLHPDDVADETYAPNMDAWLTFGPYDLSQSYWSYFKFIGENDVSRDSPELFEWLASVDGQNWHEAGELTGYGARYAFYGNILCRNVPDFGNIDGADQVWFALRFSSDESTAGYPDEQNEQLGGIFVDDIRLMVSNTEPAPAITTDEFSPRQWALHNVGQSGGDPGWDINILPAWDFLTNTPGIHDIDDEQDGIIVAVIDEGVDLAHEDLNLVEGYDATYDSEDPERVDSHGGPNPWDGHGTACAGIVGAIQNQVGIVGVAPGVKIMPVRIAFSQEGSTHWTTSDDEIADGILWAANNGAKVLSNSWGGGSDTDVKHNAIRDAKDMGCTLVFAAGNSNFESVKNPARYEEVVAVGAMSPCGERKSGHSWGHETSCDGEWFWGSNYGPELDIVAPGVMIPTCDISGDGGYAVDEAYDHSKNYFMSFNGTSSATPHVAGIAALMLTINPDLTPDDVQDILQNFARDLGEPGFDEETGHGLVNAHAAVMEAHRYGDLSFSQCSVSSPGVVGQAISATFRVENSSRVPAGPLSIRAYLSADSLLDAQDIVVGETTTTINPGGTDLDLSSVIPAETVPGWYSLIISVDDDGEVAETDEVNNTFVSTLQVIETACLVVKPASVNFGMVVTGSGNQVNVMLKNEGEWILDTLVISDISFSGDTVFDNPELNLIPETPVNLGVNESTWLWLYFMPETVGTYSGTITITSNDPNAPVTQIPLSGMAVEPVTHTITATAGTGGSISPQGEVAVLDGTNRTFTITPDTCRYVSDVLVDGASVGALTSYTFENVTADHTISASFGLLYYAITASAGTGGSISPSGLVPVACGGGRTFTITPGAHYHIADVLVDGVSVGTPASYTFSSVNTVHTIQAIFALDAYTLTIISTGTGAGTTTPSAGIHEYGYGSVVNLSASPSASSTFDGWTGDLDTPGGTIVTMDADKTVTATFTLQTFTITATAGENGTIDPSGDTTVSYGSDQVYTFAPADGYQVDTVTVDGQATEVTGNNYTFMNVVDDHTIDVTFSVYVEETVWSKTYGHADWYCEYHTFGLDVTDDGGYVFAAENQYNASDAWEVDFWVVRLDSDGSILWERGFGGMDSMGDNDYPEVVRQTSDGGFIVAGYSYSFHTGSSYCDVWVIKLTSSGVIEWQYTYGGTSYDIAYDLKESFNDQGDSTGFLLCGYTRSFGASGRDVWLVKLDNAGTVVQEITLGSAGDEYGRAVAPTPDGGCIVVADTQAFGAGGRDIWAVKLDSAYSVEWEKTFGGSGDEIPCAVVCADDGGYVVGAYTDSFGAGGNDYWALKLDADGNLVWQYTYGGSDIDTAQDLAKTDGGGYIMTGWTLSFDVDSFDAWMVKLSDAGLIQWQKSYNVTYDNGSSTWSGSEWAYEVAQAADGGYVIAGDSDAGDDRNGDVWIFKVDSAGSLGCGIETDTDALGDDTALVTVSDTSGESLMSTTSAVVGTTTCSGYNATPDVFTQCEIP